MTLYGGSRGSRHHANGRRARDHPVREFHEPERERGKPTPREIDFDQFLPQNVEQVEEQPLPFGDPRVRLEYDADFEACTRADFEWLTENKRLNMTPDLVPYLFMQSIEGRANQGHGAFRYANNRKGLRYPNATMEDAYTALGVSWKRAWRDRQAPIDDVKVYMERAARDPADPRLRQLISTDGRPLGGSDFIASKELPDAQAVLYVIAGYLKGGSMDSFPWRSRVAVKHDFVMGGGECWAGNLNRIRAIGESLEKLASEEHDDDRIAELVKEGALIPKATLTIDGIRNVYVRRKKGKGVSDDAALIMPALLINPWCMYGVMLADFVDTLDKSAERIEVGGQDEMIADMIRNVRGDDVPITSSQIEDLIYLSAIDPVRPVQWMHCSQRYFYEDNGGVYAARLHELFVRRSIAAMDGDPQGRFDRMREVARGLPIRQLSFARVDSQQFYLAIVNRLEAAQKKGILKPALTFSSS